MSSFNLVCNAVYWRLTNFIGYSTGQFQFNTEDTKNYMALFAYHNQIPHGYIIYKQIPIGLFLVTSDNYLVTVESYRSFAYTNVLKDHVRFNPSNAIRKVSMINSSITHDEANILNELPPTSNRLLTFMRRHKLKFQGSQSVCSLMYPHTLFRWQDKNLVETAMRAANLVVPGIVMSIVTNKITYVNVLDQVREKFYHQLIFFARTNLTKLDIETQFESSLAFGSVKLVHCDDLQDLRDYIKLF